MGVNLVKVVYLGRESVLVKSVERIILFNSARHCEVYRLMSGEISFNYGLEGENKA